MASPCSYRGIYALLGLYGDAINTCSNFSERRAYHDHHKHFIRSNEPFPYCVPTPCHFCLVEKFHELMNLMCGVRGRSMVDKAGRLKSQNWDFKGSILVSLHAGRWYPFPRVKITTCVVPSAVAKRSGGGNKKHTNIVDIQVLMVIFFDFKKGLFSQGLLMQSNMNLDFNCISICFSALGLFNRGLWDLRGRQWKQRKGGGPLHQTQGTGTGPGKQTHPTVKHCPGNHSGNCHLRQVELSIFFESNTKCVSLSRVSSHQPQSWKRRGDWADLLPSWSLKKGKPP